MDAYAAAKGAGLKTPGQVIEINGFELLSLHFFHEIEGAKYDAAKQKYGREIRVFETICSVTPVIANEVPNDEGPDDLYDFTAEDYHRLMSTKKEDKYLKTQKIRDAELAASRSRLTKAVIRVRFPDNHTLESTFHSSEMIKSLLDLLNQVVKPELPFYLYTTPPKKQIKDTSQDFYSAGFVPGAVLYFAYDLAKGNDGTSVPPGPLLKDDVMSLKGLELIPELAEPIKQSEPEPEPEPVAAVSSHVPQVSKPRENKKAVKPKWLKM